MKERTGTEFSLVKLSDPELVLEDREQDIRRLEAFDSNGEKATSSPPFDTDVVPQPPYQRDIYDYYGYGRAGGRTGPGAWPGGI